MDAQRVRNVLRSLTATALAGLLFLPVGTGSARAAEAAPTAAAPPELLLGQSTRGAWDDFHTFGQNA
ncbi:hypothetical protein ACWEDZ_19020, partial [Streptomyces sp. NPDC005047]